MASNDNIKFWTLLTVIILACAIGITFIDLAIKAAILEDSNELKRLIWGEQERRNESRAEGSIPSRTIVDPLVDYDFSTNLLGADATGMEAGNVSNGDSATTARAPRKPRARRVDRNRDTEIPPAN